MFHLRTTKTASGATAVQIVRYDNRKKIIVLHIGSAHSKPEILSLKATATRWIEQVSGQLKLLQDEKQLASTLLPIDKCRYLGFRHAFLYETLSRIMVLSKLHLLRDPLLFDLVLIRIAEPASKLRSLKLLEEYFGITYGRRDLYRQLGSWPDLKDRVESRILAVAKKHFAFDFSLLFYDVTTLYFESFTPDELRQFGFSKDNKSNQPQVLIGLMVNTDGFPVAYEIFPGNKFEGHSFIPFITEFQQRHRVVQMTVVADAAMLSFTNMDVMNKKGLGYIVGARLGNLSTTLFRSVTEQLPKKDGATVRMSTAFGDLICGFSSDRFRKDKHDMEKQIRKAEAELKKPNKQKRMKFLKNIGAARCELNTELIKKQRKLLGIKGYYTNLPKEDHNDLSIIKHYRNLWHVEQAFRVAKSDLQIRPIYHFKEQMIKAHILICFMALAVSKYIEIRTGKSLKHTIQTLKAVTDARILNTLNQKEITLRTEIPEETKGLLRRLGVWY